MSVLQSPFVTKSVECPVCGEVTPQRFFRHRVYTAGEVESDQHVLTYKWTSDKCEHVDPLFYHFFFCPRCFFTDHSRDFTRKFRTEHDLCLARAFNEADPEARALFALLGTHTNYQEIDFRSALNLHLLAIAIQLLLNDDLADLYKVARFFLRTAWLYRERQPQAAEVRHEKRKDPRDHEVAKALETFESSLYSANTSWQDLRKRMQQPDAHGGDAESADQVQCREALDKLFSAQFTQVHLLKNATAKTDEIAIPSSLPEENGAFFSHVSYGEYFIELKRTWPIAPADEIEAMRLASNYFQRSLSADEKFNSPQAYAAGISLVVDLMIRCSDLDEAFGMVRGMHRSSSDARQECQKGLKRKGASAGEQKRLKAQITRLNESIEHAGELRLLLMDKLIEHHMPGIQEALDKNKNSTQEELERALDECGVTPGLMPRLVEKGILPDRSGGRKKRGLFGGLTSRAT